MSLFFVNCRAHSRADGFCCDLLQQAPQIISFLKLCLVDRNNRGVSSTLKSVRWRTSNFLKSIIVQLISIWSGGLRMSWLFYSTNDTTFAFPVVASFVIFHIDHPLKSFGRKTSHLHVSSPFSCRPLSARFRLSCALYDFIRGYVWRDLLACVSFLWFLFLERVPGFRAPLTSGFWLPLYVAVMTKSNKNDLPTFTSKIYSTLDSTAALRLRFEYWPKSMHTIYQTESAKFEIVGAMLKYHENI